MVDNANNSIAGEDEPAAEPSAAQREGPRPKFEIDPRHVWITTPLLIAFFGLLGTAIATFSQEHSNTLLERNKFEYTLVQKALTAPSQQDAAKELLFLARLACSRD